MELSISEIEDNARMTLEGVGMIGFAVIVPDSIQADVGLEQDDA